MKNRKLYLLDATAFCYRAFYALPGLVTSFGQPTNAVYGFIAILNKILKEHKPDYLAVCFDVSRETFRQKKFTEYKSHRPPMPDQLSSQIPLIKEVIKAFGLSIVEKEGFEADDVIATLAEMARNNKISATIVSSDKDMLQLVDENTLVFSPYKDEGTVYDEAKIRERFGVTPSQISDIIALMGDDVDNIPGVRGIGEKTAAELIRNFGSLDKLLNNIDKIKQEKTRTAVSENIDKIKLNKELAVLEKAIDLDCDLEGFKVKEPDYEELFRIYKRLEFKAFLKDLPAQGDQAEKIASSLVKDEELSSLLTSIDEIIIYAVDTDKPAVCVKNKIMETEAAGDNLKKIFADPRIKKIGHDLKKMKIALAKKDTILEGLYFDTMIAAYLANPSKSGYNLSDLAWDFLGSLLKAESIDNAQSLDLIAKLRPKLEKELKDKSLLELFEKIEMPLVSVLAAMELTGIKIDTQALNKLSGELEKRLGELVEDIYGICGCQFNINSPKQLREVLFEKLKLPVVKKTKTGPSTDEEVLRTLASAHKLPALLLEYRQLMKLKNTYVDTLPALVDPGTGKVHTSFNQTGTETGRLSSSNPNLQNLPVKTELGRNIRKAIIAFDKNSLLLSCDYSQIELRILAHLSKDETLTAAFKEGKDIHRITAALINGVEEKDVSDQMRDFAKRVNFGIVYGLTAYGLARDLSIPNEEAQNFIDAYFARYPKVKDYIQEQIDSAKSLGFVTTISGRRRYLPEINNKNQMIRQLAERQAVNTPIQGSASDLIKMAMVEIQKQIKEKGLKANMILQIHDELLFDVQANNIREFAEFVRDTMENVLKLDVPVRVDVKSGKNWLEMEEMG